MTIKLEFFWIPPHKGKESQSGNRKQSFAIPYLVIWQKRAHRVVITVSRKAKLLSKISFVRFFEENSSKGAKGSKGFCFATSWQTKTGRR